ncbi:hypothetical protein WN943_018791 [Citrus x changshan-huyou]
MVLSFVPFHACNTIYVLSVILSDNQLWCSHNKSSCMICKSDNWLAESNIQNLKWRRVEFKLSGSALVGWQLFLEFETSFAKTSDAGFSRPTTYQICLRAGTGNPFFTIDAAAALRASERKPCAT